MKWYRFPPQAKFDRFIPKNKFYEQGKANSQIEQLFISQVENIRWAYKLATSTIHIQDQHDLKEIQIFQIKSRVANFDTTILNFIDKMIPTPIIFEISYQDKFKVIATYKRLNLADNTKVVIGQYYASDWLSEADRGALPVYLKLVDLYEHLITQLLPIADVKTETITIEEKLKNADEISLLQKQLDQLKSKLKSEKQFNRKVTLNKHVQAVMLKLNQLIGQ